ncbi:branched-chain amino acid aminotransferase [bacterium A37T11]|nr:branched-chain amino acid aminotransferase [bacterium A37T11]
MNHLNEHTFLYLNGAFMKAKSAGISLTGEAIHSGFGAFEGIRAYNTHNGARMFKAEEHFSRLERSCKLIGISYPWDNAELIADTYRLLEINNIRSAYIRPMVFSGHHMFQTQVSTPSILITAWEWGPYLGYSSLRVTVSDYKYPHADTVPLQAKITGQFVTSLLASKAAVRKGFQEAVLTGLDGFLAQAAGSNLFIEKDYKLYTPAASANFPGITRATIKEICATLHIDLVEKDLTVDDLKRADHAFLCSTAAEVMEISGVDEVTYTEPWGESLGANIQRTYKNLVLEKENYEVII